MERETQKHEGSTGVQSDPSLLQPRSAGFLSFLFLLPNQELSGERGIGAEGGKWYGSQKKKQTAVSPLFCCPASERGEERNRLQKKNRVACWQGNEVVRVSQRDTHKKTDGRVLEKIVHFSFCHRP